MRTFKVMVIASILLLAAGNLFAQENDWNDIGLKQVISKDSLTKQGYTLVFYNKFSGLDSIVKQRMIDAFFTVYPKEAALYNKHTAKKVIFIMDPGYTGVAATSGNIVRYNSAYFQKHPGDIDVVTHEVMHIVQSYTGNVGPGWLTEGIADYVRYTLGIDNKGAGWSLTPFNSKQSYKDAYRITARFLVWIQKKYSKVLVKKLDAALRDKTYKLILWQSITGKSLDELWKEYVKDPRI